MKYYLPTRVSCDKDVVKNTAHEWTKIGSKCMIVTGKHSAKVCGALDDVVSELTKAGCPFVIYDEVEENPSIQNVMKGAELSRKENCDFFIGIGGGSPLDASKAISLMSYNNQEDETFLMKKDCNAKYYPVICIPTTCGTGSEVTPYAIVTLHDQGTKSSIPHLIYPSIALLDAKYLQSAPKKLIINTACDALGHAIESVINKNSTTISETFSLQALTLLSVTKESLLKGEFSYNDLKRLLLASMFGGMAIAHTSTTIPHGISYSLTYELGIPHGRAVGLCLKGYLEKTPKLLQIPILQSLDMTDTKEFGVFIEKLLGKEQLSNEFIQNAAEKLYENKKKLASCPFEVTLDDIVDMVRSINS